MSPPVAARWRAWAALALLAVLVGAVGCYNPFSPRIAVHRGFTQSAPVPNSASNLLRLFEWCYNNRSIAEYRELFTDDYRFYFNPLDSAGADYRATPWTREDELISTTHLFVGGSADQLPADRIELRLDRNFFVYPDPDFAKSDPVGRWHKSIRTQIEFNIQTPDGAAQYVSGAAQFYVIRGDSALIPEELRLRGFGPDSNRWYIRRQNDESNPTDTGDIGAAAARAASAPAVRVAPARTMPLARSARTEGDAITDELPRTSSWGYIKVYFRSFSPGAPRPATGS